MDDLRSRPANRAQPTTDGQEAYSEAVEGASGGDVHYDQLIRLYGEAPDLQQRYSPPTCIGARDRRVEGPPDRRHVSTSHVERHNLSMRMHMRHLTRPTNAFTMKSENRKHMIAFYAVRHNFIRIQKSLRITPVMVSGLSKTVWDMGDLVRIMDQRAP